MHWVSPSVIGHTCAVCGGPATHKVGEEDYQDRPPDVLTIGGVNFEVPLPHHNLTNWLCCVHFSMIMWNTPCDAADREKGRDLSVLGRERHETPP
jgi:hypothetical protein